MPNLSPRQLETVLLRLRLVDQQQFEAAKELASRTGNDLLTCLEEMHLLTQFQVQRLRKGDTDALVLGGYKLLYRNASGSFARVYRACAIDGGEMIAVKVLRERWSNDRDTVDLFHREGETGTRLKHKNIVPIYDCAQQGDLHYITMEFVEGGNLRDFLKIRKKLDASEAMRYGLHMAEALAYALGLRITHRDLKMTNVLMSSQGVAKLIDFGLAGDEALLDRDGLANFAHALEYSTLERYTQAPPNDPRSDLFFLGTILYELLAGEPPYERTKDRGERKDIGRYRDIVPLSELNPQLPPDVTAIVDKLIRVDPTMRYQSATRLIGDLRSTLSGLTGGSTIVSPGGSAAEDRTILCVEDRPKFQNWLREYLSRHGYRVLLLSDAERALSRIAASPPDCLLLMGGSIGSSAIDAFERAVEMGEKSGFASVLVLSERQQELASTIRVSSPKACVLQQPLQLRDLRAGLSKALADSS